MSILRTLISLLTGKPAKASVQLGAGRTRRPDVSAPSQSRVIPIASTDPNDKEKLVSFHFSGVGNEAKQFNIPVPTRGQNSSRARWIAPGEGTEVHGFALRGMVYVGSDSMSEPSLINPKLAIRNRPPSPESLPYWPSYAGMSPEKRHAYLNWLADGARDPSVEIGFAFVFFYGLERRLTSDENCSDPEADLLLNELARLIGIYGKSGSFLGYATRLRDFVLLKRLINDPSERLPSLDGIRSYELPISMRIGLGRFARDRRPVPEDWALQWALIDPMIVRRTPVQRCPDAFAVAFTQAYRELQGDGLLLPQNKTKLKHSYAAASSALNGRASEIRFDDLPDVIAVTGPQKKLQSIVDQATTMIDSYSRYLGRNEGKADTLGGYLALPVSLWPPAITNKIAALQKTCCADMQPLSVEELLRSLGHPEQLSGTLLCDLARALQSLSIGIEPDVLGGAKRPAQSDLVVLFPLQMATETERTSVDYRRASVSVALAACMALADGEASDAEEESIDTQIGTWRHLDVDQQARLRSQYRLQVRQPVSMSILKAKLSTLPEKELLDIGLALATVANADGVVSPAEVKLMEQIYRFLKLDPALVYQHLSSQARPLDKLKVEPSRTDSQPTVGLSLNTDRIARLQRETDEVSTMLSQVFFDEEPLPNSASAEHQATEVPHELVAAEATVLPGLDASHTAFLLLLLTRPAWSRDELLDAAGDMEIMLDGALERINEAALDATGSMLIEGEDPVLIEQAILETITR
jgi:tellurite resistance protein